MRAISREVRWTAATTGHLRGAWRWYLGLVMAAAAGLLVWWTLVEGDRMVQIVSWSVIVLLAAAVAVLATGRPRPLRLPRRPRPERRPVPSAGDDVWHLAARPRDLLENLRGAVADDEENPFAARLAHGDVPWDGLVDFAAQEYRSIVSDRRSLLHLASRFADSAGGPLFAGFAETERLALDMLMILAEELGADRGALRARPPHAGCQARPAYVAWLALNGAPGETALALTAAYAARGAHLAPMARTLRDHPAYRIDDRACAFFDFLAAPPAPNAEAQVLSVVQESLDAGHLPSAARDHARLLHTYDRMFWTTLADGAHQPGRAPAGA